MNRTPATCLGVLLFFLAPLSIACGRDATTPTQPPTIPTPSNFAVTRLSVTGNVGLVEPGETSQLIATATRTDGSTADVTTTTSWISSNTSVLTVSAGGLVTVANYGVARITGSYSNRSSTLTFRPTPSGTFVIEGRVRLPGGVAGDGTGGLADVQVLDTLSRRSVQTDAFGIFMFVAMPQLAAHFSVNHGGYEPLELDTEQLFVDLPLQRVMRIAAGEAIENQFATNDASCLAAGTRWIPCRLVRVVVGQAGVLQVRVTKGNSIWTLNLSVDGQVVATGTAELTAQIVVKQPREVILYLGSPPPISGSAQNTDFKVETAMVAPQSASTR